MRKKAVRHGLTNIRETVTDRWYELNSLKFKTRTFLATFLAECFFLINVNPSFSSKASADAATS